MTRAGAATDAPALRSYGRRRGRALRPARRALLAEALPALAVPAEGALDAATLFALPVRALWLEIGFGGGEHLAWQAARNRDIGIVGCEPFVDGVAALVARLTAEALGNVRIWPGDARAVLPRLPDRALARCFVLFPDPWPKTRHHKRRLIQAAFLDLLAAKLAPDAELRLATDDPGYLEWILAAFAGRPDFAWCARRAGDWRRRPPDWPATRYEAKALAAGRRPAYLRYRRVP